MQSYFRQKSWSKMFNVRKIRRKQNFVMFTFGKLGSNFTTSRIRIRLKC
jgi:hypothetical protein